MACSHLYVFVHLYAPLGKSWQRNKISPSHNLHPWYKYHKQGGKCMACDKGPTDGQYCQYWRVLLSLGSLHSLRSWLIPAAQPCGSHPSQPSAARVCWHSPQILVLRCALYYWTGSWQPYSTQPIATSQLDFLQSVEILNSNLPVFCFSSYPTNFVSNFDTNGASCSILPFIPRLPILNLFCCQWNCQGWKALRSFQLLGWFQLNGVNKGRAVRQLKSHGSLPEKFMKKQKAWKKGQCRQWIFFLNLMRGVIDDTSKIQKHFVWNREYGFLFNSHLKKYM